MYGIFIYHTVHCKHIKVYYCYNESFMMITCGIEYIIIWVGLNVCEDWLGMPVKSNIME